MPPFRISVGLSLPAIAFVLLLMPASATRAQQGAPAASAPTTFAAVFASRRGSIVDVSTLSFDRRADSGQDNLDPEPEDDFADPSARPFPASLNHGTLNIHDLGSGIVIDASGLILTSGHVIADVDEAQVRLDDGRRFPAKVVGVDQRTDIGLLRIDAAGLPPAPLGDPSTVAPGDPVAAIGSPFGFHDSITVGVVSATRRYLSGAPDVPFIQTDVAINPGSSGSPLFNTRGEVIAINSMIYSETGGFMGLSFAVPIDIAVHIAQQLRDHGTVRRVRLGSDFQEMTPALAQAFGVRDPVGALVVRVDASGPAASAGMLRGDIVDAIDGQRIAHASELLNRIAERPAGMRVRLDAWRLGQHISLHPVLVDAEPAPQTGPSTIAPAWNDGLGLLLAELTSVQREALGVDSGLLVRAAAGVARSEGIRAGDVIVALNGEGLMRVDDYAHRLERLPAARQAALLVLRDGHLSFVAVPLPDPSARRDAR